jgi:hypothetical protein
LVQGASRRPVRQYLTLAHQKLLLLLVGLRAIVDFLVFTIVLTTLIMIFLFVVCIVLVILGGVVNEKIGEAALDDTWPVNAIFVSAWSAWGILPELAGRFRSGRPQTIPVIDFTNRTLRPLALCIGIATTPHLLFSLLWSAVPANSRPHSWLGQLLLSYERIVLRMHEWLKPYEELGWLWWAAIVLTIGWIAIQLSRSWLLIYFLKAEHVLSRVAFTVGVAIYFAATTSAPGRVWDPNVNRHLKIVLREEWEAIAVQETADAVEHAFDANPIHVDASQAVPAALYRWSDADLEPPDVKNERERLEARLRDDPEGFKKEHLDLEFRVLREVDPPIELSEDERRDVEHEEARQLARERAEVILGPSKDSQTPEALDTAGSDVVASFQHAREQKDRLRERAEVARTAAAEAFVKMAGISLTDVPIVKDLFKEMLEATAEAVSSRTIEEIPTDIIVTQSADISATMSKLVSPRIWTLLAKQLIGNADSDSHFSTDNITRRISERIHENAKQRARERRAIEEKVREVEVRAR